MNIGTRTGALRRTTGVAACLVLMAFVAPPGAAQAAPGTFAARATGTVVHADALQSGAVRLSDVEVGASSALVDSKGIGVAAHNEMSRVIAPASDGKRVFAAGSALEIGLAQAPSAENQVILAGKAAALAPPVADPVERVLGPVKASPAAYASLLRGAAHAAWTDQECALGDIARGLGLAADVQLLNTGTTNTDGTMVTPLVATAAPGHARAVSQSLSRLRLVPRTDGRFGLMSEVRQTIVPLTLLDGTAAEFTLEILGEWVLRGIATGTTGGATLHYGPADVSPSTPVLRLLRPGASPVEVTLQQLLGPEGRVVKIPGVAEVVLGEDPRAIGGDDTSTPVAAANGTRVSGAVDVARVKLLEQKDTSGNVTVRAADIRVGHMELDVATPAEGIVCGIPVTKVADPASVSVGDEFTTTITIHNPYDCDLTNVRVADAITTESRARFALRTAVGALALATGTLERGDVTWKDVGPIKSGESKAVAVTMRADGGAGRVLDTATATGVLANCEGDAEGAAASGVATALAGASVTGTSPVVTVNVAQVLGVQLARTGVEDTALWLLGGIVLLSALALGLYTRRSALE